MRVLAMIEKGVRNHLSITDRTAVIIIVTAGVAILSWLKQAWLGYYVSAVSLLFALIFRKIVSARFRPSNWLVRLPDHGLFIKFRSYLNGHFPDLVEGLVGKLRKT